MGKKKATEGTPVRVAVKDLPTIRIDELVPYANNAKIHGPDQIEQLRRSLREFGFVSPVLIDEDKNLIAGHGRVEAARAEGMAEVPYVTVHDLTEAQRRAYIIADNRLTETGVWDTGRLKLEMQELQALEFDTELTGFAMDEIISLAGDEPESEMEAHEDDYDGSVPEETTVREGDIYQLGRHRLMCGDATSPNDVQVLTGGAQVEMVFTDPPYGISYCGVSDKRKVTGDDVGGVQLLNFISSSLPICDTMYVCCSWQNAHIFRSAIEQKGCAVKALIVWNKINPAQHLDKYFKQHELIWYCGAFGNEKTLRGDIWECKRQQNTVHPTMKPVELVSMAIKDQPHKKLVYDPFGGSGTTLIACEQLGRTCYMMEIDPKYVQVIIDRWEKLTGGKAVLLRDDR